MGAQQNNNRFSCHIVSQLEKRKKKKNPNNSVMLEQILDTWKRFCYH